jgi:hypothetical protein
MQEQREGALPAYLLFGDSDTEAKVLVEVDESAVSGSGIAKAGIGDAAGRVLAEAGEQLKKALVAAICANANAFYEAIASLQKHPTDAEISFGLKATGELGNFAISKLAAEANYSIKLTWKAP